MLTSEKSSVKFALKDNKAEIYGKPIDLETACVLKELTTGSCIHSLSSEWKKAKFAFRNEEDLSYGLLCEKNGSKGFVLSVQAVILRNLISGGYKDMHGNEIKNSEWRNKRKILKPNESERREVLVQSLVDILWQAGSTSCAATLLSDRNCFDIPDPHSLTQNDLNKHRKATYCADGITEKVLHFYLP